MEAATPMLSAKLGCLVIPSTQGNEQKLFVSSVLFIPQFSPELKAY